MKIGVVSETMTDSFEVWLVTLLPRSQSHAHYNNANVLQRVI